jgi:hypothetical protein
MNFPFHAMLRRLRQRPAPPSPPVETLPGLKVHFDVVDKPNKVWRASQRGFRITVPRNPILKRDSRIFTMGSCFAMEIRNALQARDYEVFPKYASIAIDPGRQRVSKLPETEDVTHYDTFVIRQEFEQAFAKRHYELKDFLKHSHRLTNHFDVGGRTSWQDPYRRRVYGANEEAILDISRKMDDCIAEGIEKADIFVITLGLAETWRNIENGLHICLPPYDDARGGLDRFPHLEFYFSNYQDNYDNLKRVCTLINDNLPGRNIVLTVSPVGLGRTYPERDVVVATIEAKSILRAVAGQLSREFDNVHYWPSYDLCVKDDIYREDGRHVRPDAVAMIVDTFIEAYTAPALAVAV